MPRIGGAQALRQGLSGPWDFAVHLNPVTGGRPAGRPGGVTRGNGAMDCLHTVTGRGGSFATCPATMETMHQHPRTDRLPPFVHDEPVLRPATPQDIPWPARFRATAFPGERICARPHL